MKNSRGQVLYEIVSFNNSDGNHTGNPSPLAGNLSQGDARRMLAVYRAIKHEDGLRFRYIMRKQ
jgi:hypothetical protein